MEDTDRATIQKFVKSNSELKRLYDEHVKLESKLARFQSMNFLTPREQMEQQKLKKKKLSAKDRMMRLLLDAPESNMAGA